MDRLRLTSLDNVSKALKASKSVESYCSRHRNDLHKVWLLKGLYANAYYSNALVHGLGGQRQSPKGKQRLFIL